MSLLAVPSSMAVENGSDVSTGRKNQPDPNPNTDVSSTRNDTQATSNTDYLDSRMSTHVQSIDSESGNLYNDSTGDPADQGIGLYTFQEPTNLPPNENRRDYFLQSAVDQENLPVYEAEIRVEEEVFTEDAAMTPPQTYRESPPHVVHHRLSATARAWSAEECSEERMRLGLPRHVPEQQRHGGH